jgi:hypothetical protein
MEPRTKILILALISAGSLFWGILDLMRRREDTTASIRVQSWAQVAAGLIGLGFALSYLAR